MSDEKKEVEKAKPGRKPKLPGLKPKGSVTLRDHKSTPCPLQLSNRVFGEIDTEE